MARRYPDLATREITQFFVKVAHGSREHRLWLREAIEDHWVCDIPETPLVSQAMIDPSEQPKAYHVKQCKRCGQDWWHRSFWVRLLHRFCRDCKLQSLEDQGLA